MLGGCLLTHTNLWHTPTSFFFLLGMSVGSCNNNNNNNNNNNKLGQKENLVIKAVVRRKE